jgi:hypothetical protein
MCEDHSYIVKNQFLNSLRDVMQQLERPAIQLSLW